MPNKILLLLFVLCLIVTSETIVGPFNPSSGSWNAIYNGGFENSFNGWGNPTASRGIFSASTDYAYIGSYAAKSIANESFNGPGYCATQTISVTGGQQYILSAFFHQGSLTTGQLYIDMNDVPFDTHIGISGSSTLQTQWQFVWTIVNVPVGVSSITFRMVRDGLVYTGEYGYIDEVAFTPNALFTAPSVPEASTLFMLLFSLTIGIFFKKK
ncbi:MAG: hypothetical protein HUU50_03615 [Candidatus Brocadiae bacterium]|nr:hypothetical protein [Candidatus Brocadiia bacterium]